MGNRVEEKGVTTGVELKGVTGNVVEKAETGNVLRCGEISLWSVTLEFLYKPSPERFTHIVSVNGEVFVIAHENQRLADIMTKTVNTIDGRILQGICKTLYPGHEILRQNGSNFVFDLAKHCQMHSERLFLLGSNEKANALATQRLREEFPGIEVSGFSPPVQNYPFSEDWNARVLREIEGFTPHHLIVCFGAPKQEYWIQENASRLAGLGVRCAHGLGATIDFLSRVKPRAPRWIEFIGAEWLFRLACEPRARFRRTLTMFRMPFYAAKTAREIRPVGDYSGE
jgi:N-acetylglucosaminyldiphosphoundecaprenol N-acetyl-beta-D-mannosaminyltransferase